MTLSLSQRLGHSGVMHTFDVTENKSIEAKRKFFEWKDSYDLSAGEGDKWIANVKFGTVNFCNEPRLEKHFKNFYDCIYLDMCNLPDAMQTAHALLKVNGVLVVNAMHLTQILQCMNQISKLGLGFKVELCLEPSNRFWEVRKVGSNNDLNKELNWTFRLEDRFVEKLNRGGLCFNYWQGFLMKLRKI
jgi:tRNA A58 N-methylase Trm61